MDFIFEKFKFSRTIVSLFAFICLLIFFQTHANACGWAGDGESDDDDETVWVGADGKLIKETDTILVICRSGVRSAMAVNLLARAGFKRVYSIIDGFEGDKLKNPDSPDNGKRVINGWKNSNAPWTYELNQEQIYRP